MFISDNYDIPSISYHIKALNYTLSIYRVALVKIISA